MSDAVEIEPAPTRWRCGCLLTEHNRSQVAQCIHDQTYAANAALSHQQQKEVGAKAPPLTAEAICSEAARLVGGPRAATHGSKLTNFLNTAYLWEAYLTMRGWEAPDEGITAHDVGCLMELFKIARRFSGSFNPDDYTDAAGYAGCAGEIAASLAPKKAD